MDPITGPLNTGGAFALDTSAARTTVPQIKKGELAFFKFKGVTPGTTDKGQTLKVRLELSRPVVTTDGQLLSPGGFGSVHTITIFMYAGEGKDPTHFVKTLAQLQDATLGTGDANNTKGKPARPSWILPGSTIGNVNLDAEVTAAMMDKEVATYMKEDRRNPGETEPGMLQFPGDIKA